MNTRILIACLLIATAGCSKENSAIDPALAGVQTGAVSWSTAENDELKPGIDEAQLLYLGDLVVLWSDLPSATATSVAYGREGNHLAGGGQFINADVGEIEFHYKVNGRSSGTIVVAGESYDLSNGGLFLIAARHAPVKVLQLECDLEAIEMTEKGLRPLTSSKPEIAEFFGTNVEMR